MVQPQIERDVFDAEPMAEDGARLKIAPPVGRVSLVETVPVHDVIPVTFTPEDACAATIEEAVPGVTHTSETEGKRASLSHETGNKEGAVHEGLHKLAQAFRFLSTEEQHKLCYLTSEQRARVLALTRPILEGRQQTAVHNHIVRLDMFLKGHTVPEIAAATGVSRKVVYINFHRLGEFLKPGAAELQELLKDVVPPEAVKLDSKRRKNGTQVDAIARNILQAEAEFPVNDVLALVNGLLLRTHTSYEDINSLSYHFLGKYRKVDDDGLLRASQAMRHLIHAAVRKLRAFSPEARTGLMTPEDAWLLAELLGDPDKDAPPRTFQEIIEHRYELNPELYRPSEAQFKRAAVRALMRLQRTLVI